MKLTRTQFFQSLFGGVALALGWRKSPDVGQDRPFRLRQSKRMILMKARQLGMTQLTAEVLEQKGYIVRRESPYWHGRSPVVFVDLKRPWPWEPLGESTVRQVAREMKDFDRDLNNLRDQAGVSVEKS
jgi:hypothetical protein